MVCGISLQFMVNINFEGDVELLTNINAKQENVYMYLIKVQSVCHQSGMR